MSEPTHSPGPWWFDAEEVLVRAHNGNIVVDADSGDDIEPELTANAKLIAAAPGLADRFAARLEACTRSIGCGMPVVNDNECDECKADRAALRSAGRLP